MLCNMYNMYRSKIFDNVTLRQERSKKKSEYILNRVMKVSQIVRYS